MKYIWVKNRRFYLYDTYDSWKKALYQAKRHRKKNGCRYFIMKFEKANIIGYEYKYALYLDKCIRIW